MHALVNPLYDSHEMIGVKLSHRVVSERDAAGYEKDIHRRNTCLYSCGNMKSFHRCHDWFIDVLSSKCHLLLGKQRDVAAGDRFGKPPGQQIDRISEEAPRTIFVLHGRFVILKNSGMCSLSFPVIDWR